MMFIFCRVKNKDESECLIQSWAYPDVFGTLYMCPVHGLVNADGIKVIVIDEVIDE